MAKVKLPTMLNYTRSIVPSNGVFTCQIKDGEDCPVLVTTQTVRGTISNYSGIDRSGKKGDSEQQKLLDINNANIQSIDVCYLPQDSAVFQLSFSVTFSAQSLQPGACNAPEFFEKLERFAGLYKEKNGFEELARRYLNNIVNGRWMWRNRYATDKQVIIREADQTETTFSVENRLDVDYSGRDGFDVLAEKIARALSGEDLPLRFQVTGAGNLGFGQEVYPSQEFTEAKGGKVLAGKPCGDGKQAMMHSQKIGNAIRTIDTWHSKAEAYGAIAVEPYGVVQQRAEAVRLPSSHQDLYSFLLRIDELTEQLQDNDMSGDIHYVMACLIRGGVYSGESKKNK